MKKEVYIEVCNDVAKFVGMPRGSLVDEDMGFGLTFTIPKLDFSLNYKRDGDWLEGKVDKTIRVLPFDVSRAFKHEARHAAHFAVLSHVYDSDSGAAKQLLKKEKDKLYEYYMMRSLGKNKRAVFQFARMLLDKDGLNEDETELEKVVHFNSITAGLKESFAEESNLARNLSGGVLLGALTLFGIGMYRAIGGAPEDGAQALPGAMMGYVALMLVPHYYYRNSRSLTPKNLSRFTENERKHLLAFPSDYKPLEKRCEELRDYGFSI